jgi:peptide-methionine (S)-S-oxide reductase
METIFLAGGCLWGVQEYFRHLPGVHRTEAGRANGSTQSLESEYDGYAECVMVQFDPQLLPLEKLLSYFLEIIDPYSLNKQGNDVGEKYRTGIYSQSDEHLTQAQLFFRKRADYDKIRVEILPLTNYLRSAEEHQDRLQKFPNDYCHIPKEKLYKYK